MKGKIRSSVLAALVVWFTFFIGVCNVSGAIFTTYYVDATNGNDANIGTSSSRAWKTIAKVNRSTFKAADRILLKRGETWREQLIVRSSGLRAAPIIFGAYGSGAKPIISGADTVTGWTIYSGNIYVANVSPGNIPNQLYIDGTFVDIARYPNSGWLSATANSTDTTSIIDTNLTLPAEQIVGATAMVKAVPWSIRAVTASAYDSATHKMTLSSNVYNSSIVMRTGFGFYLQNMLWMLDSPGEWYYDSKENKVYLWMPDGDSPNEHSIEISNRSYGIVTSGKNYITIQDLTIKNANSKNVYVDGGINVSIFGLDVYGGQIGIFLATTSNSSVILNSVQNALSNGIQMSGTGSGSGHVFSNNTINNAGNVGASPKYTNAGLIVGGASMSINNNTITNSGYNGITLVAGGQQNLIDNNFVDRSCLLFDDGGGIYTSAPYNTISGNTVTNTIGDVTGTPKTIPQVYGIYLDDYSHDISVLNNTVSNAYTGIFIHTGYDNTVTGNTVLRSRGYGFMINKNTSGALPGSVHGNVVTGNIFETIAANETARYYDGIGTDQPYQFGTFNNNHYYHPNASYAVSSQYVNYMLLGWQQLSGQDFNSTDSATAYVPLNP